MTRNSQGSKVCRRMTTKSSSGSKRTGRSGRKPGKARYKAVNRRFANKLKRVRQSGGEEEAAEYSARYRYRERRNRRYPTGE